VALRASLEITEWLVSEEGKLAHAPEVDKVLAAGGRVGREIVVGSHLRSAA